MKLFSTACYFFQLQEETPTTTLSPALKDNSASNFVVSESKNSSFDGQLNLPQSNLSVSNATREEKTLLLQNSSQPIVLNISKEGQLNLPQNNQSFSNVTQEEKTLLLQNSSKPVSETVKSQSSTATQSSRLLILQKNIILSSFLKYSQTTGQAICICYNRDIFSAVSLF
jgi:hypothetical protein